MSFYWPSKVEEIVYDVQDNYEYAGNGEKAGIIQQKLLQISTNDCFYIIVYDPCVGYGAHSFAGPSSQCFISFRRGGCNVVIYRSCFWKSVGNEVLDEVKQQVEACRQGVIPLITTGFLGMGGLDYKGYPEKLLENFSCGVKFCGMIDKYQHVEVRQAGSDKSRPWGPGWWITAQAGSGYHFKYILVVGYK